MIMRIVYKGGKGSGNFGHGGRPGKVGGSAGGSVFDGAPVSEQFKNNWDVMENRLQVLHLPASWEVNTKIAPGVKKATLRSEGGFGLCAYHSMDCAKLDPTLKVYGGLALSDDDIKKVESVDLVHHWGTGTVGTVHVWNVNSAGEVVDKANGTQGAADLYVGFPIDASKFADDGALLNYVESKVTYNPAIDDVTATYNDWLAVTTNPYVK